MPKRARVPEHAALTVNWRVAGRIVSLVTGVALVVAVVRHVRNVSAGRVSRKWLAEANGYDRQGDYPWRQ